MTALIGKLGIVFLGFFTSPVFADIPSDRNFFLVGYKYYDYLDTDRKKAQEEWDRPCADIVELKYSTFYLNEENKWEFKNLQSDLNRSSVVYGDYIQLSENSCEMTAHGECRIEVDYVYNTDGEAFGAYITIEMCTGI